MRPRKGQALYLEVNNEYLCSGGFTIRTMDSGVGLSVLDPSYNHLLVV